MLHEIVKEFVNLQFFLGKKKKNKINEFILKRIYFRGLVDIVS